MDHRPNLPRPRRNYRRSFVTLWLTNFPARPFAADVNLLVFVINIRPLEAKAFGDSKARGRVPHFSCLCEKWELYRLRSRGRLSSDNFYPTSAKIGQKWDTRRPSPCSADSACHLIPLFAMSGRGRTSGPGVAEVSQPIPWRLSALLEFESERQR